MLKSCSGARSILIRAEAEVAVPVYRGEGISPHHSWDRSREAMRGDEKKDEKKGGGGGETWREFGTVRYQAKAHTSASSANLIPLTMCTRRNLLTSPFLPPWPHQRFLVPLVPYFSSPGRRWKMANQRENCTRPGRCSSHPPLHSFRRIDFGFGPHSVQSERKPA